MRRAIALLLVLVIVAGCGGDDDDSTEAVTVTTATETAGPLTRAEYIAQADAICEDFRSKTLPLDKESDRAANNLDFARAARAQRETLEILAEGTSASTPFKPRQATTTRSARSRRHEMNSS